MKIFGKSVSEYFAFQQRILVLIVVVGFGRLALSLAGLPTSTVRWLSLTALALVGIVYCAVKVPRTGFGTYKHLLPLYIVQAGLANLIIAGSIALAAVTGRDNIYSVPEYSGPMAQNPWLHAGAHVLDGFAIAPLLAWLIGSGIMFAVKKLSPRSTVRQSATSGY
jgi:hypothetical protein